MRVVVPHEIVARSRPSGFSVPLIRHRGRNIRRRPLRTFCVVVAIAAVVWMAFLLWGVADFRAAYGDKDLRWCAMVGERLVCR